MYSMTAPECYREKVKVPLRTQESRRPEGSGGASVLFHHIVGLIQVHDGQNHKNERLQGDDEDVE